MNSRPRTLVLLTFVMLLIGFSFFAQIMYLDDYSVFEFTAIVQKLTYLNIAVMVLCFVNSALLFVVSRAVFWTTPILICLVFLNNANAGYVGLNFGVGLTTAASFAFLFSQMVLLSPPVAEVLANPDLRWWKMPRRMSVCVPVQIRLMGEKFVAQTFDVSSTGAFIVDLDRSVSAKSGGSLAEKIQRQDYVDVTFSIANKEEIHCTAQVVRLAEQSGRYPEGMGINFRDLGFFSRWRLNQSLKNQAV